MAGEKARRCAVRLALGVVALGVLPPASAFAAQTTIGGLDTGANRAFAGTRNTAAVMDTTNVAAGPGLLTGIHFYASTQTARPLQFFMFAPHVSRDRWASATLYAPGTTGVSEYTNGENLYPLPLQPVPQGGQLGFRYANPGTLSGSPIKYDTGGDTVVEQDNAPPPGDGVTVTPTTTAARTYAYHGDFIPATHLALVDGGTVSGEGRRYVVNFRTADDQSVPDIGIFSNDSWNSWAVEITTSDTTSTITNCHGTTIGQGGHPSGWDPNAGSYEFCVQRGTAPGPLTVTASDPTASAAVAAATASLKVPLALSAQVAPSPITLGGSFHDTVTVGVAPAGEPAPGGTLTFSVYAPDDTSCSGIPVATSAKNLVAGSAVSSDDVTPAHAGSYHVIAEYGGDSNYARWSSGCGAAGGTEVVDKAASTASVTSSVNPSVHGQSVTFTATVGSTVGTPGGQVTFSDGATVLGERTLAAGTATLTTSALAVGDHAVSVSYGADSDHASAGAALAQSQSVTKAATTTALGIDHPSGSTYGDTVLLTATVTPDAVSGSPSGLGNVAFEQLVNGTWVALAGCSAVALVGAGGNTATCSTTTLGAGPHPLRANYGGAGDYDASTSATLAHNVTKATVHVDVNAASKTAGNPDPTLVAVLRASDFKLGETPPTTGAAACELSAHGESAGAYAGVLHCAPGSLAAANYSFVQGQAADLTITAAPQPAPDNGATPPPADSSAAAPTGTTNSQDKPTAPAGSTLSAPTAPRGFHGVPVRLRTLVVRRGVAKVVIDCPPDASVACAGVDMLTGPKRLALGKATFSVGAGKRITVAIKLSKAALKALAKAGALAGKQTLVAHDGRGAAVTTSAPVRLRA